jgi:type IV pilus assembly protein PilA
MFQRLQAIREEREGGFTLIELLVVVIIIAILAAIAIPVFLNQREKGWQAQAESSAKNAATAMETFAVDNGGSYAIPSGQTAADVLDDAGFRATEDVTVDVQSTSTTFCVEADHASLDDNVYYSSETGAPSDTSCMTP